MNAVDELVTLETRITSLEAEIAEATAEFDARVPGWGIACNSGDPEAVARALNEQFVAIAVLGFMVLESVASKALANELLRAASPKHIQA